MKKLLTIVLIGTFLAFSTITAFAESFQGVNYTIIEKSRLGSIKYSVDIRLSKKVSENFLQLLALKIRKEEPRKYDRMFITYYLPGMTPGSGAWATSHFNPNLEVKILGTTIEEEKTLMDEPKNSSGEIIGKWFNESLYSGAKYTFLKRDDKIIMIRKFKDGSSDEKEMIQKNQSGRVRFEEKGGNLDKEYYLIERNGNLGIYDNAGIILTMRSIK